MQLLLLLTISVLIYLPLEVAGEPYSPANVEILWNAPVTNLPSGLWVYKVFPQSFSPAAVSNLMLIGSFTPNNISKLGVQILDKNLIHFQVGSGRSLRYLNIAPTLGWIEYLDDGAGADFGKEEAVPDERESIKYARDFLFQLGIDRTLIFEKPKALSAGRQGRIASAKTKGTEAVCSRGVFLVRQIDGVSFRGNGTQGGLYIQFGNHGKIMSFNLVWKNLVPYQPCSIATPTEIIALIKHGKASFPVAHKDIAGAKIVTVMKITPLYAGESENVQQDFVYPFLELQMEAEIDSQKIDFVLDCPISAAVKFQ